MTWCHISKWLTGAQGWWWWAELMAAGCSSRQPNRPSLLLKRAQAEKKCTQSKDPFELWGIYSMYSQQIYQSTKSSLSLKI